MFFYVSVAALLIAVMGVVLIVLERAKWGDWRGTLESLGILLGWVAGLYAAIVWLFFWDTREVVQWRLDSELGVWNKPHDCEFFTAPIGNKNCHYRPVEVRPLEGRPEVGWIEWQKYED